MCEMDLVPLGVDQLWPLEQLDESQTRDEASDVSPEGDTATFCSQGSRP